MDNGVSLFRAQNKMRGIHMQVGLNRNPAAHRPTGTVTGAVRVQLKKPTAIEGIFLTATGKGYVYWREFACKRTTTSQSSYCKEEEYCCISKTVHEKGKLEKGEHTFRFSFTLPANLPSSFEAEHGYVRYEISVRLVRPDSGLRMCFEDDAKFAKKRFTVSPIADLNLDVRNQVVPRAKASGVDVYLNKTGFVPGEKIHIHVRSRVVPVPTTMHTSLHQHVMYSTGNRNNYWSRIVAKTSAVLHHTDSSHTSLRVPAIAPTKLGGYCTVHLVYYVVEVMVDGRECRIPVNIGNVPVRAVPAIKCPGTHSSTMTAYDTLPSPSYATDIPDGPKSYAPSEARILQNMGDTPPTENDYEPYVLCLFRYLLCMACNSCE